MTLLLALIAGCSLNPRALDVDGDGFLRSDCDDSDDTVYPGATEACDGADNNCDGKVDESGCTWLTDADARFIITGEDGLGPALGTGQFDGDGFGDLVVQARFGDAPGVCLIPGARLVDGLAGSPGSTPLLSDVSSCWVSDGDLLGITVTSGAPFGEPGLDVAWVLSTDDGLCAVDPFGDGVTLEQAGYGCSGIDAWDGVSVEPSDILDFEAADPATATLMARTPDGIGVASIATMLDGPGGFWALSGTLRGVAGGEDVDGDGIGDIVAVGLRDVWIVSSDLGLTVPIEVAGAHYIRLSDRPSINDAALPGDLDGDGLSDWGLLTTAGLELYSGSEWYCTIESVEAGISAGDFNGDARPDIAVRPSFSSSAAIFLGPMEPRPRAVDADVLISQDSPTFASGLSAIDVDADGESDLWITDPGENSLTTDTASGAPTSDGTIYLLAGFPIDHR